MVCVCACVGAGGSVEGIFCKRRLPRKDTSTQSAQSGRISSRRTAKKKKRKKKVMKWAEGARFTDTQE